MIVAKYPDCKVYVAGREHVSGKGIKAALRRSSYSCYLRHLIKKNKLWNNLIFLGPLSAEGVKERLLNSNVFVSSSIIENSPNSLGEAMMLGVPCVASDVGGTTSMCSHNHECFIYQANAAYMLAYYVCRIFAEQDTAKVLSENACEKARNNHSRVEIVNEQLAIYKAILSSS